MFDHGQPCQMNAPLPMADVLPARREVGVVLYERNILGWEPREFQVALPTYVGPGTFGPSRDVPHMRSCSLAIVAWAAAVQVAGGHADVPAAGGPVERLQVFVLVPRQKPGTKVERRSDPVR